MPEDQPSSSSPICPPITLYQYMSWEDAEKVFTNWDLKATLPCHTNDPFELKASDEETELNITDIERTSPFAFLCFSKCCKSAALWGHYGDSHKGICLEFTFPLAKASYEDTVPQDMHHAVINHNHNSLEYYPPIVKIQYQPTRYHRDTAQDYRLNDPGETNPKKAYMLAWLATKDISWAFEQEYRIISLIKYSSRVQKGLVFFDFPMHYLTGIHLGVRCQHTVFYVEQFVRQCIQNIPADFQLKQSVEKSTIRISQMEYAPTTFEVLPSTKTNTIIDFASDEEADASEESSGPIENEPHQA